MDIFSAAANFDPIAMIVRFFRLPFWGVLILTLKIIAGIVVVFSVFGIIMAIIRTIPYRDKISARMPDFSADGAVVKRDKIAKADWAQLVSSAASATDENASLVVIRADKIVDNVLKKTGIPGETMGDRISAVAFQLKSINDLWEVHRLRNRIAHDPQTSVTASALGGIIKKYENNTTFK